MTMLFSLVTWEIPHEPPQGVIEGTRIYFFFLNKFPKNFKKKPIKESVILYFLVIVMCCRNVASKIMLFFLCCCLFA